MTQSSQMYAALSQGFDAGRTAARAKADGVGLDSQPLSPEVLATEGMTAMVKVLHDAGCLREPEPPTVEMTLDEAAALLCRLALTRRLDPGDPADVASVVATRAQFEFAWACVQRAGINPVDATAAHTAYRLLAAHHGLR